MAELRIYESSSLCATVVAVLMEGNPFAIKAVAEVSDGVFVGVNFIEVSKFGKPIVTSAHCAAYGVEHSYTGDDASLLSELCEGLSKYIEEKYGIRFLSRQIDH